MIRFTVRSFIITFLLVSVLTLRVLAQPIAVSSLSADQITLLNSINDLRRKENQVLLVPNDALNKLADFYLSDLLARPIDNLGDTLVTRNKENLETLLDRYQYPPFSDGYTADIVPLVVRGFGPAQIVTYWNQNFRNDPTLLSRQMVRQGTTTLPMFSRFYREIGIAYKENTSNGRDYYVFVFAAQPNVLPIIVADLKARNAIAENVSSRSVLLYVNDENSHRAGGLDFIGGIQNMRVSEQKVDLECPTGFSTDWEPYQNAIQLELSDSFGSKTIYVELCDNNGKKLSVSTTVNYGPATPEADVTTTARGTATATPDVLLIANATQTAAANATLYAPYVPTVESILTATASASD